MTDKPEKPSALEEEHINQHDVLRLLVLHPELADEFMDAFKNCFNGAYDVIYLVIRRYWQTYAKPIPESTLRDELAWHLDGVKLEKAKELASKLYGSESLDVEYVANRLREFIEFQKMANAMSKGVDILQEARRKNDSTKLGDVVAVISDSLNIKKKLRPKLTRLASVQRESTSWLWHPYIPFGKLTLMEGDPSSGKTFLSLAICMKVTNGEVYEYGTPAEPANVIYMTAEDGMKDTIKPRFEDMGGDCSRFYCLEGMTNNELITLDNIGMLEEAIKECSPKLIVIDPLQAYLGAKVDMHRANEVRPILAGLGRLAEAHKVAVIVIRHLSKSGQSKAAYRGMGSIDITAAARSVLLVGANPNDPTDRAFIPTKSSLAEKGAAYGFTIETGKFGGTQFTFKGESELTVDDLLAAPAELTKTDEAESFLKTALKDGGKKPKELKAAANNLGFSWDTLKRAKNNLGVMSECIDEKAGVWHWKLPPHKSTS